METLPKDVRMEIALDLSPPDLIRFCTTETKQNKEICESETFWRQKLEKDYPEELLYFYDNNIPVNNPKKLYIDKFTFLSSEIENYVDEFIHLFLEKISKYLTKQYKEDLFNVIFDVYSQILKEKAFDEDEIDEIVSYSKIGDFVFGQEEEWMESSNNFISYLISKEISARTKRRLVKKYIGKK